MSQQILQPNKPVKFTARNHRPFYKRLRAGDFYGGSIEYDKETWEYLQTIPDNAIIEIILYYHDGDPDPTAKPEIEEVPGKSKEHVAYWSAMFHRRFHLSPHLIEVLECAGPQVKLRLRDIFQTDTLNSVSPETFEDWLDSEQLTPLITISREVRARLAEVE